MRVCVCECVCVPVYYPVMVPDGGLCLSPAVTVFGRVEELNGIVGKSVTFPAVVDTSGNIMYHSKVIASVSAGARQPLFNEYDGRLQWDGSTGLFSLSSLKVEDMGEYKVQNSDGPQNVDLYKLTVYGKYDWMCVYVVLLQ